MTSPNIGVVPDSSCSVVSPLTRRCGGPESAHWLDSPQVAGGVVPPFFHFLRGPIGTSDSSPHSVGPATGVPCRLPMWWPICDGAGGQTPGADSLTITMERVLLLNATYEPLALVSDRRAVVLVLAGRAEAVAFREDCAVFHSASLNVDVPSIVRLAHMVRIPRWARTPPVAAAISPAPGRRHLRLLLSAGRHHRSRHSPQPRWHP